MDIKFKGDFKMKYNTTISKRDREIAKIFTMIYNADDWEDYEFMAKYLIEGLRTQRISLNHWLWSMDDLSEHMRNIA